MAHVGLSVFDDDSGMGVWFPDESASRWWAVLQPVLHPAADVDEQARVWLRLLGRHSARRVGGVPVASPPGVAAFRREYSSAEARAALGNCSRAWLYKLQNGTLKGFWFKRPGRGGHVLVFDADAVDALAASQGRGRSISSRPSQESAR